MSIVTFIIPSIGRSTLKNALESLVAQTDQDWSAVIVFDGVEQDKVDILEMSNIKYVYEKKQGHAGLVRNIGFQYTETPWIAFLDDDDTVTPTYVAELKKYEEYDVVIFNMNIGGRVYPDPEHKDFVINNVGISFAIKKQFRDKYNILFPSGEIEDYEFLNQCRSKGAKYILTHSLQYLASGRNSWNYF